MASILPWFLPGLGLSVLLALFTARRLGHRLGTSRLVACALVVSIGAVVAATIPPDRGALALGMPTRPCDLGRLWLAPLSTYLQVGDTSLNVALFVPLGVVLSLLPASRTTVLLVAGAFLLPVAIELVQLLVPALGRGCQSADMVDNALGLVIGLAVGTIAGRMVASQRLGQKEQH